MDEAKVKSRENGPNTTEICCDGDRHRPARNRCRGEQTYAKLNGGPLVAPCALKRKHSRSVVNDTKKMKRKTASPSNTINRDNTHKPPRGPWSQIAPGAVHQKLIATHGKGTRPRYKGVKRRRGQYPYQHRRLRRWSPSLPPLVKVTHATRIGVDCCTPPWCYWWSRQWSEPHWKYSLLVLQNPKMSKLVTIMVRSL